MVKLLYTSQLETETVAIQRAIVGGAITPEDTQNFVTVTTWDGSFRPQYALVHCVNTNEICISRAGVYNNNVVVAVEDSQDDIIAVVGDYGSYDNPKRVVFIPEKATYVNAPVLLRLRYERGEVVVALGVPFIVIAVAAAAASLFGGFLAYEYVTAKKEEAEAKKMYADTVQRVVDYAIQNNDIETLRYVFIGAPVITYEEKSDGSIMDSIKSAIKEFVTPLAALVGVIITMMKLRIIADLLRGLTTERR